MMFIKIINEKKFVLISLSLFLYVMFNLFDGERGLISYYEKQKILESLKIEKEMYVDKLALIKKKNDLLTKSIDLDYIETLYRNNFVVGKSNEKIFMNE
jgi:cell division protein DivIC